MCLNCFIFRLREVFDAEGSQLTTATLDCLGGLDISEMEWKEVRFAALDKMLNAPLRDIPVYFSFLLKSENPENLEEVSKL